jgi:hypothetical protein
MRVPGPPTAMHHAEVAAMSAKITLHIAVFLRESLEINHF